MALTPSSMLALGTLAPDFKLKDVVSGSWVGKEDIMGGQGMVVMFICRHCPYVIHVQDELARLANDYLPKGVGFVAISANDVSKYPEDSPENMARQSQEVGFNFPYLYDETQSVAKAYQAECTPDFFLFDNAFKLVYRGRLDESSPGNNKPLNGEDLRKAINKMIAGDPIAGDQYPSMGCNIKWK